jgi:hypothetical protein
MVSIWRAQTVSGVVAKCNAPLNRLPLGMPTICLVRQSLRMSPDPQRVVNTRCRVDG